jgi:hypothetical protein
MYRAMAELGVGMSKWRQVRIDEIADKNAKKGFIFLRLPEVPQFEGRPVSSLDADTG